MRLAQNSSAFLQSMRDSDQVESVDAQLKSLRSSISDLGYQVDSYKTRTAGALGAGVFLLLLAAGSFYDLIAGGGGVWARFGLNRATLIWIAGGLGVSATVLLALGILRLKRSDMEVRARLDQMERQYADLVERTNAGARNDP